MLFDITQYSWLIMWVICTIFYCNNQLNELNNNLSSNVMNNQMNTLKQWICPQISFQSKYMKVTTCEIKNLSEKWINFTVSDMSIKIQYLYTDNPLNNCLCNISYYRSPIKDELYLTSLFNLWVSNVYKAKILLLLKL